MKCWLVGGWKIDKLKVFRKISALERCFVASRETSKILTGRILNRKILITVKMTEMTTKRKEGIVKVAKTSRLTGPEYSNIGNIILLAVFHTLVYNFIIIILSWWLTKRQHNDLKCLLGDFCNYCRPAYSNHLELLLQELLFLDPATQDKGPSPFDFTRRLPEEFSPY